MENNRRLPTHYVAIGDVVTVCGHRYRCVKRPSGWSICEGCALNKPGRHCASASLRCSKWDRRDGENVWFEEL